MRVRVQGPWHSRARVQGCGERFADGGEGGVLEHQAEADVVVVQMHRAAEAVGGEQVLGLAVVEGSPRNALVTRASLYQSSHHSQTFPPRSKSPRELALKLPTGEVSANLSVSSSGRSCRRRYGEARCFPRARPRWPEAGPRVCVLLGTGPTAPSIRRPWAGDNAACPSNVRPCARAPSASGRRRRHPPTRRSPPDRPRSGRSPAGSRHGECLRRTPGNRAPAFPDRKQRLADKQEQREASERCNQPVCGGSRLCS